MNQIILYIMAAGAVIGGLDRIFGNRLGLGEKFEQGFQYLGPMALSMVGIICLAPVMASGLEATVAPLFRMIGVDPAMLGGLLAIDMGGYPLAMQLADQVEIGRYAGIIVSAIFGCTLVFTIPVGMGLAPKEDHPAFARGIMIGLAAMPVALIIGGLIAGLGLIQILHQNLPTFVLAILLMAGLYKIPNQMVKGFQIFAKIIEIIITIGLILAAVTYMTKIEIIKGMAPIEEAMATVASIGIILLGSLPLAEILQRILQKPFKTIGSKLGLDVTGVAALLISFVSVLPSIAMLKDMSYKSKVVNVAAMVSSASLLGAHLGFTIAVEPIMPSALLAAKIIGAIVAAAVALALQRGDGSVRS